MITRAGLKIAITSALLGLAGLPAGAGAQTPEIATVTDSGGAGEPGSWKEHKYDFFYMGFTSTYSCDGLADKLQLLLKLAGARDDAKSVPLCSRDYGVPDKLAQARLSFSTLQAGDSGAGAAAATPPVEGTWRHVELQPRHPLPLELGDCELVEQFRERLLPMFATRNVSGQITCVPHQESGTNYVLSFDVFVPAPPPKAGRAPG